MPDLSIRILRPELLDSGHMPDDEVHKSLLDLRRVNRLLGGRRVLLAGLAREVSRRGLAQFTVLDVASGSCDLPMAVLNWAERRHLQAHVFALEYWHKYLAMFRDEFARQACFHPICGDALRAPLAESCVDFVTCSLFLHHLNGDRAIELLRDMSRWARHAVIVNDLERRALPYHFFRLFSPLLLRSSMSRSDGLTSIGQSYRTTELEHLADAAGLRNRTVERRWPFRLLLIAEPASVLHPNRRYGVS